MNLRVAVSIALLSLAGCVGQEGEVIPGSSVARVQGLLHVGAPETSGPIDARAVVVWTYWRDIDCEVSVSPEGYEGRGCSGSTLAMETVAIGDDGRFNLDLMEAPPDFVHGYSVELAEGFVAAVPADTDLSTLSTTQGIDILDRAIGVENDFVIVHAPRGYEADTLEAGYLGSAVGPGFHLVRPLVNGPQFTVQDERGETTTSQRGQIEPLGFETELVLESVLDGDGYVRAPSLGS